jgi:nitric oxide dioxygenase
MTPEQIRLVRSSFAEIAPVADTVAEMFYEQLFELDPSLRALFRADMADQGKKLVQVLAAVVQGLDRTEALLPTLRALGARHVGYGVRPEHYDAVGAAFLLTLQSGLGERFTPAVSKAWAAAYGLLAGAMQEPAAADAAAA